MTVETSPLSPSAALTISPNAAQRLKKLLGEEPANALRVSVKGGGCSGFQYGFDIERDGVRVIVDPVSLDMIRGSELDFVDDLIGQSFRVKNPNAKASCGCGVSFTI